MKYDNGARPLAEDAARSILTKLMEAVQTSGEQVALLPHKLTTDRGPEMTDAGHLTTGNYLRYLKQVRDEPGRQVLSFMVSLKSSCDLNFIKSGGKGGGPNKFRRGREQFMAFLTAHNVFFKSAGIAVAYNFTEVAILANLCQSDDHEQVRREMIDRIVSNSDASVNNVDINIQWGPFKNPGITSRTSAVACMVISVRNDLVQHLGPLILSIPSEGLSREELPATYDVTLVDVRPEMKFTTSQFEAKLKIQRDFYLGREQYSCSGVPTEVDLLHTIPDMMVNGERNGHTVQQILISGMTLARGSDGIPKVNPITSSTRKQRWVMGLPRSLHRERSTPGNNYECHPWPPFPILSEGGHEWRPRSCNTSHKLSIQGSQQQCHGRSPGDTPNGPSPYSQ